MSNLQPINFKQFRDRKFKKRLPVFLFFLAISTVLWFFNALNKNYSSELNFPVTFTDMPSDKVNVSELPKKLKIKINADGFTILSHKFSSNFMPLKIKVNLLKMKQLSPKDSSKYYVLTSTINQILESQFNKNFKVEKIKPDSLYFYFTHVTERKFPVKLVSEINFKNQFMLKNDIILSPDSIKVKGAASVLDTITYIYTKKLVLEELSQDYSRQISLQPIENVEFLQDKIDVRIETEEYTEVKISVPIEVINVPDTINVKIFPNKVGITYLVGFSNYEKILEHEFRAVIDYSANEDLNNSKLQVQIVSQPMNVKSYTSKPSAVDYIIE